MRGEGYYIRNNTIYIDCEVNGKRVRRSTGLPVSRKNISYVKKHIQVILQQIVKEGDKTTFANFGKMVLENGRYQRSESHHQDVMSKFERGILPSFKDFEFEEIKPIHIENWQNKLLQKYSVSTVKKYTVLLKRIMTKAVANDLCQKNPFDGVTPLKAKKPKRREIYTEDEIAKLIQTAKGWMKTFLITAFGTAMRTGELMALKWSDIDFKQRTITVQRNIRHAVIKESTKTGTSRIIDLLDPVYDSLSELYQNRKSDIWVFPSKEGNPFTEVKNIHKYHFLPLLKESGVKYKTLYASRHSFISIMLNKGMDLMWVQKTAGHASATTTLSHYAMYIKPDKTRLEKANNILKNDYFYGTITTQEAN